ncbi:DUF3159 domain-containing protein [Mycobacterium montefiorense]|nr:hypothetical protein [Mycobacterium montefiorense]
MPNGHEVADGSAPQPARQPGALERIGQSPIAGFAPWIIYGVVASGKSTWLYGALAAAVAAIILAGPSILRGSHKMLDLVTIAFFVALTIAGIATGAKNDDWMDTWSATLSSGILAAVALGSLAFVPFTEQYARESTPREVWDHPAFKRTNRVLTLVWGLTFAANSVLAFVSVKAPDTGDWTAWVIPTVLLVTAFKITASYPDRVRARASGS